MGFWDFLRREQPLSVFTPNVTHLGSVEELAVGLDGLTPAEMWATQPHLRTVVSFLARNIAQLGLHSFERDGEDRHRDRSSVFAATMRRPNPDQTAYELIYGLVGDIGLYDRAYWLTVPDVDAPSGWVFRRLPPSWVSPIARDAFGVGKYAVVSPSGQPVEVPSESVLAFTGYHPSNPRKGSPTVEALKETLGEQIQAAKYRSQVWKRGGRVSAVLERPKDAPSWTNEQADRFREDWYQKYTGDGSKAGGTPILEDGMTLRRIDFNAQEQQFVEAAKLSFATVAAAFHVNPTMVGILDNANYSNVREFRRMLYGDTLGPLIAQIEDRINTFLLPRLGMDNAQHYAEFNIAEKLQGSFEEQAAVMQTLVGAPLMTRNEGRGKFNLPALAGGDALVTPLNVLEGGQASPTDSGSQNRNEAPRAREKAALPHVKADLSDNERQKVAEALAGFFKRQGAAVLSRLGAGVEDWWDGEKWDRELTQDLLKVALALSSSLGAREASRLGFDDGYDADRTVEFLTAASARRASNINTTTKTQLDDVDADPAAVFTEAAEVRAEGGAQGLATFIGAFAVREAARQIAYDNGKRATKTWVVTSANPRASHAQMDGETVGVGEPFSNGMQVPGEGSDVDEVAGCSCTIRTNIT